MNFVYAIQIQHDFIKTQKLKIALTKVAVATNLKPSEKLRPVSWL